MPQGRYTDADLAPTPQAARKGRYTDADIAAPTASAAPSVPTAPVELSGNPNREGVYQMVGPQGQKISVAFSNVPRAQSIKYGLIGGDVQRFQKDYQAIQPGMLAPKHTGEPGPHPSD
jgi:hypothetical protein